MQIHGFQPTQATQGVSGGQRAFGAQRPETAEAQVSNVPQDELELSAEAQTLSDAQAVGATEATNSTAAADGIRWDKVNALREAIANGDYDTPERMSASIDRMLDALA